MVKKKVLLMGKSGSGKVRWWMSNVSSRDPAKALGFLSH